MSPSDLIGVIGIVVGVLGIIANAPSIIAFVRRHSASSYERSKDAADTKKRDLPDWLVKVLGFLMAFGPFIALMIGLFLAMDWLTTLIFPWR